MVNGLCKKKKDLMKKCGELATAYNQKVYLCILDDRLNRLTEYQSELEFNFNKVMEVLKSAKNAGPRVKLALRTYVGDEQNIQQTDKLPESDNEHPNFTKG